MRYLKRLTQRNFLLLLSLDIFLITISFYLSILFRFDFQVSDDLKSLISLPSIFLLIFVKIFSFRLFSLYRGMWRYTSVWDMLNIIKANSLASFLIILITFFTIQFETISRSVFIIDYIVSIGVISVSRLGIRMFFTHFLSALKTKNLSDQKMKRVILIGAGDSGQTILRQSYKKVNSALKVIGFLDDDIKKFRYKIDGVPVLGKINELSKIEDYFDEIYICIPSASRVEINRIVDLCKKTNKPFKTLPSFSELIEGEVSISQFREVSIIDLLGREEIELDKKTINKFLKGKRVLITGAGGSIGSELVRQCAKFDPSILIMLDVSELNLFKIDREVSINEDSEILFKPILLDIKEKDILEQTFKEYKPQVVFHAAAYKHVPIQEDFPWEAIKTNIFGTYNVSSISKKYSVEKFVLVSTDKAVKPTNVMGATKRLAEIITQNLNRVKGRTDFISVRFGNVLGSSGSVIPIFQEQIKEGGPLTVTDPNMERYFMSIPEASQLILQAGAIGEGGEIFILDMGDPVKIIDIAKDLIRLSGLELDTDISIKYTGTRPGEKKVEELSLPYEILDKTKHEKIFVLNDSTISNKKIENIIQGIDTLEKEIIGKSANEVRLLISSILDEYSPDSSFSERQPISNDKVEA